MFKTVGKYHKTVISKSLNPFSFGDESFRLIGVVTHCLEITDGVTPIPIAVDIIFPDIPPLLGLSVTEKEKLNPDVTYNILSY